MKTKREHIEELLYSNKKEFFLTFDDDNKKILVRENGNTIFPKKTIS